MQRGSKEAVIGRRGVDVIARDSEAGKTRSSCVAQEGSCRFATMTKLLQWLWTLALLGTVWAALTLNLVGPNLLPPPLYQVLWPLPTYLLVMFGCYSLGVVGYRVATFNDCEEAARELQAQVREARSDLARQGMKF